MPPLGGGTHMIGSKFTGTTSFAGAFSSAHREIPPYSF